MATMTERLRKALIADGFKPYEGSRDRFVKDVKSATGEWHKRYVWLLTGTLRATIDDDRVGNSIAAPKLTARLLLNELADELLRALIPHMPRD